jgi:hypothetical protein
MNLVSILRVVVIASFCVAAPARTEHPHAKILGALIYTDLSIAADGEPATAVMSQLHKQLGVLMQVYWENSHYEGISRTAPIFLTLENKPAVVVLERIMEQLSEDEEIAWQIRDGVLEIGFKSRFSTKASLQLIQYPITDLLFTIRDFDEAPTMGSGGNSGSGNGPTIGFGSAGSDPKKQSKDTKVNKIIQLITKFVEPEQWDINGGECSIDSFRDTLLINAPDYVHRQIGGYPYEPIRPSSARVRRVDYSKGRTTVQVPPSIQ